MPARTAGQGEPGPLLVAEVSSQPEALAGWVVVDSLVDGMAMGGTRMTEAVTRQEVERLARAMSEKLTLVGLPIGGAKAGIVAGPGERDEVLRAFGRTAAPLLHGGIYLGCDLGTTHEDRDVFLAAARYDVRDHPRVKRLPVDWGTFWTHLRDITGHGVAEATAAAITARFGTRGCRVVVQGFGTVGRAVAASLEQRGHRVVAVADVLGTIAAPAGLSVGELVGRTTPAGTVERAGLPDGVAVLDGPEAWLDVDADVLVLAAAGDAIRGDNVHRVVAEVVVEGGNLCCTTAAKDGLAARGVLLVPDVVANVGGAAVTGCVLTGTVPFDLPLSQMVAWFFDWVGTQVRANTAQVLEVAHGRDPVAELLAQRRRAQV
ncbi:Glu/Leu/Phe/Val dehydrogenase [Nocardioides campestrisoli]|uniref:Glu/Leu/Phe/Val dehydrogenase n=1 Tax=Nocardioides campestrisoli TaxID=2736757 RepID=UPI00163DC84C|nr:Glu/Leu/Phe/Val dehydrogenase [Nocardioides campestrisoli]